MNLTNKYPSLKNKVVFISGGATGIGASLVEAFCRQQSKVVFVDIQDDEAEKLISNISENDDASIPRYFKCNLIEIERLRDVIKTVRKNIGPVSVLVNNAASDVRHDFRTVTEEYWNERINVN